MQLDWPKNFWEKPIQAETLQWFANTNGEFCNSPIGIALEFHGMGHNPPVAPPEPMNGLGLKCTEKNILYIAPYYGPWNWMNNTGVITTNEIVAAAQDRFSLLSSIPIVAVGGSMGGLSALTYTRYSPYNIVACATNCPVCDAVYSCGERPDVPRTLYNAFLHYSCSFFDAVRSVSPLHQITNLPQIPYYFVHGEADVDVALEPHSGKMVRALRERGHKVIFESVPDMAHCALEGEPLQRFYSFILEQFDSMQ